MEEKDEYMIKNTTTDSYRYVIIISRNDFEKDKIIWFIKYLDTQHNKSRIMTTC